MGNEFGLGLVLSFTDNASAGINSAVNSLNQLTSTAESASNSLNNIASLSALSAVSGQLGNMFTNAGNGIINAFSGIINKVQNTGQEFTIFRNTARALFGRTESDVDKLSAKVENAVAQLMDFSAKTIFETKDLTGQFVTITANGYDAFADMTATASGQSTKLMGAIADLMTFRSDVRPEQWAIAIRNAFGGQVRSLKAALDINPDEILGHAWSEGDIAQNFVDLADKLGVLGLAGGNFESNIQAQMANISDIFTKFYLQVADTGVFDLLTQKTIALARAINEAFGENQPLVEAVAEAMKSILTPVVEVAEYVTSLIPKFAQWAGEHPQFVKLVAVVGALAGVLLLAGGVILKVTSALSGLSLFMLTFGKNFGSLGGFIRTGSLKILGVLTPLALTISMLALAWKNDFGDIKTNTIRFGQNIISAFKYAKTGISGNVTDMRTVLHDLMNENPFVSKLATGIMKVTVLFQSLCEAWNDNTLSEDTFNKARELGLLPLIETILDIKFRFENFVKGFVEGVKEVADSVINFVSGLNLPDSVTQWFTNLLDTLASSDPQKWQDLGKAVGELATKAFLLVTAFKLVSGVFKFVKDLFLPLVILFSKGTGIIKKLGGVISKFATSTGLSAWFAKASSDVIGFFQLVGEEGLGNVMSVFFPKLTGFFSSVSKAVIASVSSLGATGIAIIAVALSGIIAYATTHWEEFKSKLSTIWEEIKSSFSETWESIKATFAPTIETIKASVSNVVEAFKTMKDRVVELALALWDGVKGTGIIELLSSIGEAIINIIVPAVRACIGIVAQVLSSAWNIIVSVFNAIVNFISTTLGSVMNVITGILDIIIGIFTLDLDKIWTGVKEVFSGIFNFITGVFTNITNVVSTILGNVWNIIIEVFEGISNTISGVIAGIMGIVQGGLDFIGTFFTNTFGNISTNVRNTIENIKNTIHNGLEKVKGFFSGLKLEFPKIKMPHFTVSGSFSLNPLSVPKLGIDWYANGGVFSNPTMIGVGEQGTEAVMPLENNTQWIGVLAKMIRTEMQEIRPTNTHLVSRGSDTNTGGYMTTNNSTSNVTGDTDNSITFASGAIQITANNSSEEEAERLAKRIMELIKRQKQLDGMMSYA